MPPFFVREVTRWIKVKAYVLHGVGDLRYADVSKPSPQADEVLIRVKASGVCGSDIPRIYRTGAHRHPLIPGHEFSGVVESAGGADGVAWEGKRVGVFPLIPCRQCGPCQREAYEMCQSYGYLGSRQDGGFAEYVATPVRNLIALPDKVSFEEAAMLEPMAVAVHAMRRVAVNAEDTVAVCGLGTIGRLLTMVLYASGVKRLLLIGNKESQRQFAENYREAAFCDTRTEKPSAWLAKKSNGKGIDVFFECVGKNETVELGVECATPSGRVVFVGNPASDMTLKKDVYWQILRRQLSVTGTWNSSFTGDETDDWHEVLRLLESHAIAPADIISHRLTLADLERGFRIMRDKTEDFGKIMAVME